MHNVGILTWLIDNDLSHTGRLFFHQRLFDKLFWSAKYTLVGWTFENLFSISIVTIWFGDAWILIKKNKTLDLLKIYLRKQSEQFRMESYYHSNPPTKYCSHGPSVSSVASVRYDLIHHKRWSRWLLFENRMYLE